MTCTAGGPQAPPARNLMKKKNPFHCESRGLIRAGGGAVGDCPPARDFASNAKNQTKKHV
jgi:hypothetical protein